MIRDALVALKDDLNTYFANTLSNGDPNPEPAVVFVNYDQPDGPAFNGGKLALMLVNVEEETTLRRADRYLHQAQNGEYQAIPPDIRLNLYVLFVASAQQYETALDTLSLTIQYFQTKRMMDQDTLPGLPRTIDQLAVELVTLPFAEQNELWGALRAPYRPSVLYRLRMLVFQSTGTPLATIKDPRDPEADPELWKISVRRKSAGDDMPEAPSDDSNS